MSRHYKAITNHVPMDYGQELDEIAAYFAGRDEKFLSLFERWNLRPLDPDDVEALIARLERRLNEFALYCNALPLRTPQKLTPTVRGILKDPWAFVTHSGNYDPEAVAMVYGAFARGSLSNRMRLLLFEAGIVGSLPIERVQKASAAVLRYLEAEKKKDSHSGGQALELRGALVADLAEIFESFGGVIKLVTQYDPEVRADYRYKGPFHDFLELVLPPVQPFAARAGFRMDKTRSMILTLLTQRASETK